ncbi:cysteine desulfurase-like protein [Microlunatus flavus]|uniref:Cysteine desulfurase family protein, VC1184 subfamily n=1 Tax=Microlunatus flavus TaxID=1036181 RepID=A0A1H9A3T1_9ACTN|nr:cysteine desulfurase-like protein [Microlunatus flavus]SEP71117.1 cysteine desulfurase family protein, VC1184 subfamily [Microlunatus flavus]
MTLDVARLRAAFPALDGPTAYFDGPGGTQTPAVVGEAVARALTGPLSNRGSGSLSQRNADDAVRAFRQAYADLLAAAPDGIVHGRSATQLTYDLSRALARTWSAGDNVVVSRLDHDANVRPWVQAAALRDVEVRWLELDPATAELDLASLAVVDERTRLVALTGASNLVGTIPPHRTVADRAHAVGALLYVDGVHLTAHRLPDPGALGADLYVCSPYKFFGPHCGVLAADPALLKTIHPDKLAPSTDRVPERFELGTLPYEVLAGATAAVDFLADLPGAPAASGTRRERLAANQAEVHAHEQQLRERLEAGLAGLGERVVVHSRAADRTPTLFLTFPGRRSADVAEGLLGHDVLAPAGSFYAVEPFRALALDDDAGVRVGLAAYTDAEEVDRLLAGLDALLA